MTPPSRPRPTWRAAAQVLAFVLILLPGLGQHLTRAAGHAWLSWAWFALSAIGMALALLLP